MKYKSLKRYASKRNTQTSGDEPSGCSGTYIRLPHGVGVKVYDLYPDYDDAGFKKPQDVRKCAIWWTAANALNAMRRAYSTGHVPKPYCLAPIKVNGRYYVGLFMEHIIGKHGYNKSASRAHKKISEAGVILYDHGSHNTIIRPDGKPILIDFDHAGDIEHCKYT